MNCLLYSSFTKMLDSKKYIKSFFGEEIVNKKVLFVPFADEENKYYLALCKQALCLSGINKQNISTLSSHTHKTQQFDIIFVSGGNVCRLKDKLVEIGWFDEIRNRINSGVLYIGDSAGAVILGQTISHTLAYEPYEKPLENYDGLKILDKSVVVHFSKKKYSGAQKKMVEDKDCYLAHVKQTKFLGRKNFFTIKNNQLVSIRGSKLKNIFFSNKKIILAITKESQKYGKELSKKA